MNLPNNLTITRAILGLFIMLQIYYKQFSLALFLFIIGVLTDFFDGFIARRREIVTPFGKLIDPVADKVLVLAVLIAFVDYGLFPAWIVFLIFLRDIAVTGFRSFAALNKKVLAANLLNKIKSSIQYGAIIFTLFALTFNMDFKSTFYFYLYLCVAVITLISGIFYIWQNREAFNEN